MQGFKCASAQFLSSSPSTMSLACLACTTMEGSTDSFRMEGSLQARSLSVRSDKDSNCGTLTRCWAKRPASSALPSLATPPESTNALRRRVAPVTEGQHAPRLTRCYALRRDGSFSRGWSVEHEVETARGRQLASIV